MGSIRALFKFVFVLTGLLLIGVAVLAIVFAPRLEGFVQQRLEKRMTETFGAETSVEGLKWAFLRGEFALVGLRIQNPEPFPPEPVFHAAQITLRIDLPTIFSEAPRISEILVEGTEIHLRYQTDNGLNLARLALNAREQGRSEKAEDGRRIRVGTLRWDEGHVRVSPGPPLPFTLPPFTLEGIGEGQDGVEPAALMATALQATLRRAVATPGMPSAVSAVLERFLRDEDPAATGE